MTCKICKSSYKRVVGDMATRGIDINSIFQFISPKIEGLLEDDLIDHLKGNCTRAKLDSIEGIDIYAYLDSIGLKSDLTDSTENKLAAVQRGSYLLLIKAFAVVDNQLENALATGSKLSDVKGLTQIFSVYKEVIGLKPRVDLNAAVESLIHWGYEVHDPGNGKITLDDTESD